MRQIILASSSKRRKELMGWLGLPFEIVHSDFPEEEVDFHDFLDDPDDYVATIAAGKAMVVADKHPDALVIASDTMVYLDGEMHGKPKNLDDARVMLSKLRGKTHTVFTAVVMMDGLAGNRRTEIVQSKVTFLPFPDEALERYIASSEPYDKAGGYALQGEAKKFVEKVEGSMTNVFGFPIMVVRDMLEELGIPIEVDIEESVFEKTGYRS